MYFVSNVIEFRNNCIQLLSKFLVTLREFCLENPFGIFSYPKSRDSQDCLTRDFRANGCKIHAFESGAAVNLDRPIRRDVTVSADYKASAPPSPKLFTLTSCNSRLQSPSSPAPRAPPCSHLQLRRASATELLHPRITGDSTDAVDISSVFSVVVEQLSRVCSTILSLLFTLFSS